jgi:exodeoxyribonuclease VII large subunit
VSAYRERLSEALRRMRRALFDMDAARRENRRLGQRLRSALARDGRQKAQRLDSLRDALAHLDPTRVLARGYSIVRDSSGHVRVSSAGLARDDVLDVTFSEGGAEVGVRRTR